MFFKRALTVLTLSMGLVSQTFAITPAVVNTSAMTNSSDLRDVVGV